MSENNINTLCFQQFYELILMVRLFQHCFYAMFGHLGEFLVLLELLGRISEPTIMRLRVILSPCV